MPQLHAAEFAASDRNAQSMEVETELMIGRPGTR